MASQIFIDGNQVLVTLDNWQSIAKRAIDSLLARKPDASNAEQLATMNAVKVAGGAIDNASPFHIAYPGSTVVEENKLLGAGDWADEASVISDKTSKAFDAVTGGFQDTWYAAKNSVPDFGEYFNAINADIRLALILGAVAVTIFGFAYLRK